MKILSDLGWMTEEGDLDDKGGEDEMRHKKCYIIETLMGMKM